MTTNLARKLIPFPAKRVSYEGPIKSDSFSPTGNKIGFGCWGEVEVYKDLAEQEWAIKRFRPNGTALDQMKSRGWSEERVMREEAVPLEASIHHVVPRIIERDKKGETYIGMPYFKEGDFIRKN